MRGCSFRKAGAVTIASKAGSDCCGCCVLQPATAMAAARKRTPARSVRFIFHRDYHPPVACPLASGRHGNVTKFTTFAVTRRVLSTSATARRIRSMKRLMVVAVFLLAASVVFAGGEGKSCKRGDSETVKLTGTVACAEGSGADCARVFRVANDDTQYTICDKSKVDLASLEGAQVRI